MFRSVMLRCLPGVYAETRTITVSWPHVPDVKDFFTDDGRLGRVPHLWKLFILFWVARGASSYIILAQNIWIPAVSAILAPNHAAPIAALLRGSGIAMNLWGPLFTSCGQCNIRLLLQLGTAISLAGVSVVAFALSSGSLLAFMVGVLLMNLGAGGCVTPVLNVLTSRYSQLAPTRVPAMYGVTSAAIALSQVAGLGVIVAFPLTKDDFTLLRLSVGLIASSALLMLFLPGWWFAPLPKREYIKPAHPSRRHNAWPDLVQVNMIDKSWYTQSCILIRDWMSPRYRSLLLTLCASIFVWLPPMTAPQALVFFMEDQFVSSSSAQILVGVYTGVGGVLAAIFSIPVSLAMQRADLFKIVWKINLIAIVVYPSLMISQSVPPGWAPHLVGGAIVVMQLSLKLFDLCVARLIVQDQPDHPRAPHTIARDAAVPPVSLAVTGVLLAISGFLLEYFGSTDQVVTGLHELMIGGRMRYSVRGYCAVFVGFLGGATLVAIVIFFLSERVRKKLTREADVSASVVVWVECGGGGDLL